MSDAWLRALRPQGSGCAPVLTRSLRFAAGCGLRAGPGVSAVLALMAPRRLRRSCHHQERQCDMQRLRSLHLQRCDPAPGGSLPAEDPSILATAGVGPWHAAMSEDRRWALLCDSAGRNLGEIHRPALSVGPLGRPLTFEQVVRLMSAAPEMHDLVQALAALDETDGDSVASLASLRDRARALLGALR